MLRAPGAARERVGTILLFGVVALAALSLLHPAVPVQHPLPPAAGARVQHGTAACSGRCWSGVRAVYAAKHAA